MGGNVASQALRTSLALLFAVGLVPFATAHTCEPGKWSIDPSHLILVCVLICILVHHICSGGASHVAMAQDGAILLA